MESMLWYKQAPWHSLGVRVDEALTSEEAMRISGLDWPVVLLPTQTQPCSVELPDGTTKKFGALKIPMTRSVVRATDCSVLGTVGNAYHPLQNAEAFKIFDTFVKTGDIRYETAGSLRGGKRVWILASITKGNDLEILDGDYVKKYLLLSTAHDGTLSTRFGYTPTRVVCANTLRAALEYSQTFSIRHNVNIVANLEAIAETLNLADQAFEATADQYRKLTKKVINKDKLEEYVKVVFFGDADSSRGKKVVKKVTELSETGRGTEIPGVRGTVWGAFNAVVEYLQYEYGNDKTTDDTRVAQLWYGQNGNLSQRALDNALKLAA